MGQRRCSITFEGSSRAMLETHEASFVTGPVTKEEEDSWDDGRVEQVWAEKGCKKYAVDNDK